MASKAHLCQPEQTIDGSRDAAFPLLLPPGAHTFVSDSPTSVAVRAPGNVREPAQLLDDFPRLPHSDGRVSARDVLPCNGKWKYKVPLMGETEPGWGGLRLGSFFSLLSVSL